MAANTKGKKVVRKRRERKNVEKGQVHIRSSFNNTMVTVTDLQATLCPGPPPAAWASAVPVRALRLLHRWLLNRLQKQLWNMAFVR